MAESVHPIRAYRLSKSLRLSELAKSLGTTSANLSRIETGKQAISDRMLPKLIDATGIGADLLRPDIAELFGRKSRIGRADGMNRFRKK